MRVNRVVKVAGVVLLVLIIALFLLAAFSHHILPTSIDECQQDVSHRGHIAELPAFHCIGHSEWDMEKDTWDHVHSWMSREWQLKQQADESHPGTE
jgi:hypothetical protein